MSLVGHLPDVTAAGNGLGFFHAKPAAGKSGAGPGENGFSPWLTPIPWTLRTLRPRPEL